MCNCLAWIYIGWYGSFKGMLAFINPISCSSDFKELTNVSTFNTSILRSPWSLVRAMTVIGLISKRFLVSNVPLRVPNVLIMVPSNYFIFKAEFLNLGFPKIPLKVHWNKCYVFVIFFSICTPSGRDFFFCK